ncbi:MAG: hypothetical protein HFI58_01055 [Lachnospiraceae bacterium]|nr:hypothetical protein [Lachnospiraceae bacterium]
MAKDNNRSCGENSSLWAIFFYDRMFASGICPKALEYNHTDIWLWLGQHRGGNAGQLGYADDQWNEG